MRHHLILKMDGNKWWYIAIDFLPESFVSFAKMNGTPSMPVMFFYVIVVHRQTTMLILRTHIFVSTNDDIATILSSHKIYSVFFPLKIDIHVFWSFRVVIDIVGLLRCERGLFTIGKNLCIQYICTYIIQIHV